MEVGDVNSFIKSIKKKQNNQNGHNFKQNNAQTNSSKPTVKTHQRNKIPLFSGDIIKHIPIRYAAKLQKVVHDDATGPHITLLAIAMCIDLAAMKK
jgi:hypothetical protein